MNRFAYLLVATKLAASASAMSFARAEPPAQAVVMWDGGPSLGGAWIAHPDHEGPDAPLVSLRNDDDVTTEARLVRRGGEGRGYLLAAETALALGLEPGEPARIFVERVLSDEATSPENQEAAEDVAAGPEGLQDTAEPLEEGAAGSGAGSISEAAPVSRKPTDGAPAIANEIAPARPVAGAEAATPAGAGLGDAGLARGAVLPVRRPAATASLPADALAFAPRNVAVDAAAPDPARTGAGEADAIARRGPTLDSPWPQPRPTLQTVPANAPFAQADIRENEALTVAHAGPRDGASPDELPTPDAPARRAAEGPAATVGASAVSRQQSAPSRSAAPDAPSPLPAAALRAAPRRTERPPPRPLAPAAAARPDDSPPPAPRPPEEGAPA